MTLEQLEGAPPMQRNEQYFIQDSLLAYYERIGLQAELRLNSDGDSKPILSPRTPLERVFILASGARAKFGWNPKPTYVRSEGSIVSGSLTIRDSLGDGGVKTELFVFQHHITGGNASSVITHYQYEDKKEVNADLSLQDPEKLRELNCLLEEIENIENDGQAWRQYDPSYSW